MVDREGIEPPTRESSIPRSTAELPVRCFANVATTCLKKQEGAELVGAGWIRTSVLTVTGRGLQPRCFDRLHTHPFKDREDAWSPQQRREHPTPPDLPLAAVLLVLGRGIEPRPHRSQRRVLPKHLTQHT